MGLVISLAVVQGGLTPDQALHGGTRGGALSLQMADHGLLAPGAAGDVVVLDAPSADHIAYRPATNLVWKTIKSGRVIANAGR
jgi:imidazolonepropionase